MNTMDKEEISFCVKEMIARIRELPEGTCITTAQLLDSLCYNNDRNLRRHLLDVHFELLKAAEKEGITLDMSSHDGKIEGLPYNLDFVIHHNEIVNSAQEVSVL